MKVKAANGFARAFKAEGIPWVSCYPTNHVNNALGEEGVPILMMGEERFAVAVADALLAGDRGKQIGVCTVMANLNAAGIQMAYGAIAQAWEDSSPLLVITEGVGQGASRHTHYDMAEAFKSVTKWVGKVDRAELVPDYMRRAFTQLRSGRPGPVLLIIPRDLGEYDEAEHPYAPVKGWRSGPDPDDVKAAVKALLAAKDPLLYVGEGVVLRRRHRRAAAVRRAGAGAGADHAEGQGHLPGEPPALGGRARLAGRALPAASADVLFSIGSSLFPNRFSHAVPDAEKKTIVQCTVDTLDINRSYETRHAVIGDAKLTLQALIDELSARAGGARKKPELIEEIRAAQAGVPGEVPPVDGVERDADQPVPGDRRPHEGARPEELVRHRRLRQHARPDQHGLRGADPARLPRLGQRVDAGLQPGRGRRRPSSRIPDRQCVHVTGDAGVCYMMGNFEAVARYKIGITTLHINNGGYSGYGPGFWGGGHDPYTWKVSDHALGVHGVDGARGRLPRRGRDRAVGDHPGAEARASTRTPRAGRPSWSSSARTIRSTAAGSGAGGGH